MDQNEMFQKQYREMVEERKHAMIIAAYRPPDAPPEVRLLVNIPEIPAVQIVVLDSPAMVDAVVAALIERRDEVFGKPTQH